MTTSQAKATWTPLRYGRIPCACVCKCKHRFMGRVCPCPWCLWGGLLLLCGVEQLARFVSCWCRERGSESVESYGRR